MDDENSFHSVSPPSSGNRRSRSISRSNSTKYMSADDGNSDSDQTFCDVDSDVLIIHDTNVSPTADGRYHMTEKMPLLIDSMSYKRTDSAPNKGSLFKIKEKLKNLKPLFLFIWCVVFAGFFVSSQENQHTEKFVCVSPNLDQEFAIPDHSKIVRVKVKGPFLDTDHKSSDSNFLSVGLAEPSGFMSTDQVNNMSVNVHTSRGEIKYSQTLLSKTIIFEVPQKVAKNNSSSGMLIKLKLFSEDNYYLAVSVTFASETVAATTQIVFAFLILVFVYILIIFELVHRATAAMLGGLSALSVLSYLDRRPTLETVIMWIQWETLTLLFGMMILVAIFAQTGFFDYIALKAYKISKGRVWGLVTLLCVITSVASAFLDNVTTILLLTPVTIRLCQVLNLDPTNVLIAEVIFSNIGGTATAIGDPPNVLLVSDKQISSSIGFTDFTKHLLPGIVFCLLIGYAGLRLLYLRIRLENNDSPEIAELKREIDIWRRTADRVPHFSAEEKTVKLLLLQKILRLETTVRNMERRQTREQVFKQNLKELEDKYKITDFPLLVKSGFVILVVVALFFIQSFTVRLQFPIGWIAVIGALALILLAHIESMEELMEKVEWTTLVFFAGLFVLMEALRELGLFDFLSETTSSAIQRVNEQGRLPVAIIAIIWISALVSSFVDNIPFTQAMIPITITLHSSKTADLPLQPLVWALAMGACLGGNGTLIGASANVVCAGLSEQYGYPISFIKFTKIGFPMMLLTVSVAMGYLLICHVVLHWDNI